MENQIITFSAAELIANVEDRTISGKIVPAGTGEVGNTSAGRVVFEQGAIALPEDAKTIKLLNQHDHKQPLGKATSFTVAEDGIYASFKISRSNRGSEALILAEEGLQAGLSVGVEVIKAKNKGGIMHVSAAKLFEVSLVTDPAFKSAQVTDIAAEETPEAVEEIQPTESETAVENTPETVAAPVEAAAVEAARPTVAVTNVRERTAPITSEQYLGASIKAALGDNDARRIVEAADDTVSTNTGLTLPAHLTNFITTTFSGRPAFGAVTQAGPVPQLSFTVPKMGTAPTTAVVAEAATVTATGMTSTYDTITASKYSSINRVSFELLDFSNPAFETLLLNEMRKGYEKATDAALISAFTTSGVQASTTAATAAGLQSFIATESAAAYKGTGGDFATKLVASTDQWAAIQGYVDSSNRPLYNVASPQFNAPGQVTGQTNVGNILGTDLIVDHNITTSGVIDESAFLVAPGSVYVWESPVTNLRINVLSSGEIDINMYAYLAIYVAKGGAGVRRFNLT